MSPEPPQSNDPAALQRALGDARAAWGADWKPRIVARAPGRLELLGNHVDYNGGPVLAAAIDRDAFCLVREQDAGGIVALFPDLQSSKVNLDRPVSDWRSRGGRPTPADYLTGAIAVGLAAGADVPANAEVAIAGDVPMGLGLSSSAALCVALCLALHRPPPAGRDLVLRAQEAEHRAGTPCGTMDQSASVGGGVILYDGAATTWEEIQPDLGDYAFAVADSGVARSLGQSLYPLRVAESRRALAAANRHLDTRHAFLAALSFRELQTLEGLTDTRLTPTLVRRIRHVVTEVDRVRQGVAAVRDRDWERFGALMNQSGQSSATDYEISHPRVEELVACAQSVPGVAGARMMGGGEGGVALILARADAVPALREMLNERYFALYPVPPENRLQVFRTGVPASRIT